MARETTGRLVRPVLRALQALPPSVLLKTPSRSTPTYMVVGVWGSMARALTERRVLVRPVLTALQVAAASVLLKTPSRNGAEKRVVVGCATAARHSTRRIVPGSLL